AELGGGARKRLARANALHEARDYAAALAIYQTLASSWRDTDIGDAAEEKVRAYRTPEMRRELAAFASLQSLEQKLANANAGGAQRVRAYREFAKRAEGTAAGDRANDLAAALEE
ncbi:MAG: hypothetical protein HY720_18475, partial [Planctomycetes bacterium]|nr:hypothetical protein [Planctomycetota bacterium]